MSEITDPAGRRAQRLLRCYPRAWRVRYGEEFAALLVDEFAERPHSLRRTADIVRCGLAARLEPAVLPGEGLDPERQLRAGLAVAAIALAAFLVLGLSVWSQLTVSWQWAAPQSSGTMAAMWLMSGALLAMTLLVLLAAVPVLRALIEGLRHGQGRRLAAPLMLSVWGGAVLWVGGRHFGLQWPGTGGHPWSARGIVPVTIAEPLWAVSSWISTFWIHPSALLYEPAKTVAWLALSPLALTALLFGGATVVRRLELPVRTLRFEAMLAMPAAAAMIVFLGGVSAWLFAAGPEPGNLFRVGLIDYTELAVMALALVLATRAARRAFAAATARAC
jgi:hypothetical protein